MAAQQVGLKKTLKLWQVVVMGLAYLTPMAVFDTFGIVTEITEGHVPTAYLFALIGMLFTALSYGHLVRKFPSAGSAYTYAQKVFHPYVGFMVGWTSLLDYMFMPMINMLLAKIYLQALFPEVEPWTYIFGLAVVMTALNLRGIKLVANFNSLIVIMQFSIIAVFIGLIAWGVHNGEGLGTVASSRPFFSEQINISPLLMGASILCLSFLGFDAISTLSEETPDADRVIPPRHCADGADRRCAVCQHVLLPAALLPGHLPLQATGCSPAGDRPLCRRQAVPGGGAGLHYGGGAGLGTRLPRRGVAPALCNGS